ncbi:MAG: hypothetical protein ACOVOI_17300 [Hyphomicrobiales bacterium]
MTAAPPDDTLRAAAGRPPAPQLPNVNSIDSEPRSSASTDSWEGILETLRRRYPGQKDSVLFCIYKLQHNPDLTLRDFAAEAKLYGIPTAGRALHSARQLLGLIKETPAPAPVLEEVPVTRRRRDRTPETDDGGASIETKVLAAVRQIQSAASGEAEQLRAAIRQAIAILQRAVGD